MTRLEAGSEPSMEEILASIRKIIAEEPPGSRAAAPLRTAQPVQTAHAGAPASIDRSLFAREAPHVAKSVPASSDRPDRNLPDSSPNGRDSAKSSNAGASAVSVEAQLSDLLDSAEVAGNQASPAAGGRLGDQSSRTDANASTSAQTRFTDFRHGSAPAAPSKESAADPFEFDLGPSPFSRREQSAPAPAANPAVSATKQQSSSAPYDYGKRFQDESPSVPLGAQPKVQPPASQPAQMLKPTIEPRTVTPTAAPSIAATMAPQVSSSRPSVSPHDQVDAAAFARSVEIMSRRSGQRSVHDVVTEAVNAAMQKPSKFSAFELGETPVAVEVDDSLTLDQQLAVRGGAPGGANVPAVRRDGENALRTMEDTVADLLRPMLKAWLAENMPRIIERALRREISDMDGSGRHLHKTAAE